MVKSLTLLLCLFTSFAVLAKENIFLEHYNQMKEIERQQEELRLEQKREQQRIEREKEQERLKQKQDQQREAVIYLLCLRTIKHDMLRFFFDPRQIYDMPSSFFEKVCKCSAKELKEEVPDAAEDLLKGRRTRAVDVLLDMRFAAYHDCLGQALPKNVIWIE